MNLFFYTDDCALEAEGNNCHFYSCMDEVSECHGHRYTRTLGRNLCEAVRDENIFTKNVCIMNRMIEFIADIFYINKDMGTESNAMRENKIGRHSMVIDSCLILLADV